MISIDLVKIIALMPVRDFPTTSEGLKKTHLRINYLILIMVVFSILLLFFSKWDSLNTVNGWGELMGGIVVIIGTAWLAGLAIQIFQCLDYTNQIEKKEGNIDSRSDPITVFSDCFASQETTNSFLDVCTKYAEERGSIHAWECLQAFNYLQTRGVVIPSVKSFTLFGSLFHGTYPTLYKVKNSGTVHPKEQKSNLVTRLEEAFPINQQAE